MKTIILSVVGSILSALSLTSCYTLDIPVGVGVVHGQQGPIYQIGHPGFGGQPPGFCGPPPIIYGDQRRTVYGNGPQSYVAGFTPPGPYDPNYQYGFGTYRCR